MLKVTGTWRSRANGWLDWASKLSFCREPLGTHTCLSLCICVCVSRAVGPRVLRPSVNKRRPKGPSPGAATRRTECLSPAARGIHTVHYVYTYTHVCFARDGNVFVQVPCFLPRFICVAAYMAMAICAMLCACVTSKEYVLSPTISWTWSFNSLDIFGLQIWQLLANITDTNTDSWNSIMHYFNWIKMA